MTDPMEAAARAIMRRACCEDPCNADVDCDCRSDSKAAITAYLAALGVDELVERLNERIDERIDELIHSREVWGPAGGPLLPTLQDTKAALTALRAERDEARAKLHHLLERGVSGCACRVDEVGETVLSLCALHQEGLDQAKDEIERLRISRLIEGERAAKDITAIEAERDEARAEVAVMGEALENIAEEAAASWIGDIARAAMEKGAPEEGDGGDHV